jgi:hypothetical protein
MAGMEWMLISIRQLLFNEPDRVCKFIIFITVTPDGATA